MDKSNPSKRIFPWGSMEIRTDTQTFVLQKNRNSPPCTFELSKTPQDCKNKKPPKKGGKKSM